MRGCCCGLVLNIFSISIYMAVITNAHQEHTNSNCAAGGIEKAVNFCVRIHITQ